MVPDHPYPGTWEADVVLRDGGVVHIRPIRPDDAELISRFHARQSAESIYFRYFTARPALSERELRHLTNVDYADRMAFVALLGDEMVGVGRYERWGDTRNAEVAFFVDDEHAARGIGSVLLEYLVEAARDRGLTSFNASVLPENRKMLNVFSTAGFEVSRTFADGVIEVTFDLHPTSEAVEASTRRRAQAEAASVRRLFTPHSVAVIGAGTRPDGLGHQVVRHLVIQGFTGPVWPINERAAAVSGLPGYRGILDVPAEVDLAVIATPAERVLAAVEDCARKHVRALVILTAGFSEIGDEGAHLEARVIETARRSGVRVLGPNCLGLVNTDPEMRLHATAVATAPRPGRLGVLAQSGTLGAALVERTRRAGLGLSSFVAAGNRADIGASDLLRYWTDDDRTHGVLLYLEAFGRVERFLQAARAATRRIPVAAVVSSPDDDRRIAAAICRQTGIIRVGTLRQLLDLGRIVDAQGVPSGPRIAVVGNSGGAIDLTVGQSREAGLDVVKACRLSWEAGPDDYAEALASIEVGAADAVMVVHAPPALRSEPDVNRVIGEFGATRDDLVVTACLFDAADVVAIEPSGDGPRTPVFEFPEHGVRSLGRLATFDAWKQTQDDLVEPTDAVGSDNTAERIAAELRREFGDGRLPVGAERSLLSTVGVSTVDCAAANPNDAADTAAALGFPVAVKMPDRDLALRSEAGGVVLDLPDEHAVRGAAARLRERFGDRAEQLIVQRMIDRGADVAVTFRRRPKCVTVTVGMGGVYADESEAALGILPATRGDIALLVGFTPVGRALGRTSGTDELVDLVMRLARLMRTAPTIESLVANPVIVTDAGASLADVSIELGPPPAPEFPARRLDVEEPIGQEPASTTAGLTSPARNGS